MSSNTWQRIPRFPHQSQTQYLMMNEERRLRYIDKVHGLQQMTRDYHACTLCRIHGINESEPGHQCDDWWSEPYLKMSKSDIRTYFDFLTNQHPQFPINQSIRPQTQTQIQTQTQTQTQSQPQALVQWDGSNAHQVLAQAQARVQAQAQAHAQVEWDILIGQIDWTTYVHTFMDTWYRVQ
jgi:hypothetical protein